MTTLSRLERLEEKLKPKTKKTYWIMWQGCEWKVCNGIYRAKDESIEAFKARILKTTNKQILWVG